MVVFKQMLDLDYRNAFRLRVSMDRDTHELVAHLATKLGMAFEDAAPVALTLGALSDDERAFAVGDLKELLTMANAVFGAIIALTC